MSDKKMLKINAVVMESWLYHSGYEKQYNLVSGLEVRKYKHIFCIFRVINEDERELLYAWND